MLGKLSVPGRRTSLDDSRTRAYCASSRCGWGLFGHFFLSSIFSIVSLPLLGRLKYCLKGPLPPPLPPSPPHKKQPGRVAQSVGHLTCKSYSWVRYPVWPHTFVSPSADSRRVVVSYWRKYVHKVLINR